MLKKPSSIQINVTERCNLRCIHCNIWKKEKIQELTNKEWMEIIIRLKDWLGLYRLDISGGEPFLRKDFTELIEFCQRNGIKTVVTTNATYFDKNIIMALSEIDNLTLNISLDGADYQTYDYLRGVGGTHKKVLEALYNFKSAHKKCHITIATILMGYNINEIMDIVGMVVRENLADGINFQALDHNFGPDYDSNWRRKSNLWPENDKKNMMISVIEQLIALKAQGKPIYNSTSQLEHFKNYFSNIGERLTSPCDTGNRNFIINPTGKVLLCWNMPPVGDIVKALPEEIWNSPLANARRIGIGTCNRSCRILNCNFIDLI